MSLTKRQQKENNDRADLGDKIIGTYMAEYGESDDDINITDIVADLMHSHGRRKSLTVANAQFNDIVRMARTHFEAEWKGGLT